MKPCEELDEAVQKILKQHPEVYVADDREPSFHIHNAWDLVDHMYEQVAGHEHGRFLNFVDFLGAYGLGPEQVMAPRICCAFLFAYGVSPEPFMTESERWYYHNSSLHKLFEMKDEA